MTARPLLLLILATAASPAVALAAPPFTLSAEDRVVFVGNTLMEREQAQGYLETALALRNPGRKIIFRNLGWSGDTVFGEARAAFDPPPVGYKRLIEQVTAARPTVLFIGYGGVESFDGPAGLPRFVAGLNTFLNDIAPLKARLVFLGPIRQEDLGRPLPDPAKHNRDVRAYRDAIKAVAAERAGHFVDLYEESGDPLSTTDGVIPDNLGYWQLARRIEHGLSLEPPTWSVELDKTGKLVAARGTALAKVEVGPGLFRFEARDATLPASPEPHSRGDASPAPSRTLTVHGLPAGRYSLAFDGLDTGIRVKAEELDRGVDLRKNPGMAQVEQLRAAIIRKNRLEFYRYRPQNETYLYGFRKHEQGKNAAEVVQFDPLVAAQEEAIARLTMPAMHTYELRAEEGNQ